MRIVLKIIGALTLGVVILMAQKQAPADLGKTYEAEEIPVMLQTEVVRIQEDPYMPRQAKRMALGALAAHGVRVVHN